MKKRIICAALIAAMVCGAAGCGGNTAQTTTAAKETTAAQPSKASASASEIAAAILEAVPINSAFEKSFESLGDYFDGLDTASIEDSSFYICASGAYPDEIAVFRFNSADAASAAILPVNDRLEYQKTTYKDYTPAEYYKLEDAVISQSGEWLIYLVTSDNTKAEETAYSYIG